MHFTISGLLNIKEIEGLRLVAGEDSINNQITNTNVMDNPDTFEWLIPGDFVVTTGYVFKDDAEFQRRIIKELSDINCAGLAIKPRKYFGDMPKAMIDAAREYNLPLIEIPKKYSLGEISNIINKEIFKSHDTLLEKSLNIHQSFTDIALNGGGLEEITTRIVQIINNPLILVDSNWDLLTYRDHKNNVYPLHDYLTLQKKQKVFPMSLVKEVPNDVEIFKKSIKRSYRVDNEVIVCRIMPIAAMNEIFGYMVVWETVSKMRMIDYIALEKASTIAAIERMKTKEIEEVKHQIRRDFFDDILAGKIESINSVKALAEIHGMDITKNYVCMVIKLNSKDTHNNSDLLSTKRKLRSTIQKILRLVDEIAIEKRINIVSIYRSNQIIIFLPIDSNINSKPVREFTKDFGYELYNCVKQKVSYLNINIGIGRLYDNILKLSKSFYEAQEVMDMGKKMTSNRAVFHYEDFIIYHLLESVKSKGELQSYFENTVSPLIQYDEENNTKLVETLEQYFACKENISEAAKKFFVHRNTFIYRLDKIKSILNTDLKDAEDALEIQLGLKVMHFLRMK